MGLFHFIARLLGLKELKVNGFKFKGRFTKLYLKVKPYKNGTLCPKCQRRCKVICRLKKRRIWRDLPVCGMEVFFTYKPREIQCPTHGRIQEEIPWGAPNAHITYRFEYALLKYCQKMTQKMAAQLLHIPQSTLSDMLHRIISRIRHGHKIRNVKNIGIDEISYCKGHKYATIVYDLERSCVIWVGKGKVRDTIDDFFTNYLSKYQREQIQAGCCDMSETFIGAIEKWCPNATLILDRFHIVKALNNAVDEVRKKEWREADKNSRKALKGMRWVLYRHSSNRTKKDIEILKNIKRSNRHIYRASVLKDEFEQFWDFTDKESAEEFLKAWTKTAMKSRLESLKKFVKTLRKHAHRIVTFAETRITNAISEGLNRLIKIIKNRASGFQNLKAFTDLIYLTVGDLDIPGQIHKKFHAI